MPPGALRTIPSVEALRLTPRGALRRIGEDSKTKKDVDIQDGVLIGKNVTIGKASDITPFANIQDGTFVPAGTGYVPPSVCAPTDDGPPNASTVATCYNPYSGVYRHGYGFGSSQIWTTPYDYITFGPDHDADGYADLYVSASDVQIFSGATTDEMVSLILPTHVFLPRLLSDLYEAIEFGNDITGDGVPELFAAETTDDRVVVVDGALGHLGIEYDFVTPGAGGLSGPEGLTFGNDLGGVNCGNHCGLPELLVSSYDTDEVLIYDGSNGIPLGVFVAAGEGGLDGPKDLELGPDLSGDGAEDLYVSSHGSGEVLVYDGYNGAFVTTFVTDGSGGLVVPNGLAFGPPGSPYGTNLYVMDAGNSGKILAYDDQGTFIKVVTTSINFEENLDFEPN